MSRHRTHIFYRILPLAIISLLWMASTVSAAQVTLTSVKGWPNGRISNDTPPNAVDGNTGTFTWTTESFNASVPSYLGVGFSSIGVGQIRLWKENDGGGGTAQNIKDLIIQYTTDSSATALDLRTWVNVTGLTNGILGSELLDATAVNANGTVTGDIHSSAIGGDGWASLTFDPVLATGIRIAFQNPSGSGFEHYRVGEFEVYSAIVPEPSGLMLAAVAGLLGLGIRRRRLRAA